MSHLSGVDKTERTGRRMDKVARLPKGSFVVYNRDTRAELAEKIFNSPTLPMDAWRACRVLPISCHGRARGWRDTSL
jgi:hypothetical protein